MVNTPCPRYSEAVQEVLDSKNIKCFLNENVDLFNKLTKHSGLSIKTPDDIQSLFSTLQAETAYGLKLPSWTDNYYPAKMQNITELSYIYNIYTNELKQLKAGPFIKKMLTQFEEKRNSTLKPAKLQISLYAGHDSTVVNILSGFNVWEKQLPSYDIMALFDLVRDRKTNALGVQIYLRNSTTSGAVPLTIPGCDHFCPLDKFIEIGRNVIPKNHDAACKPKNSSFVTPSPRGP